MGHNVVITKTADVDAAAQAGIKAGPTKNYVDEEGGKVIAQRMQLSCLSRQLNITNSN